MNRLDWLIAEFRSAGVENDAWPGLLTAMSDYLGAVDVVLGGGDSALTAGMLAPRTDPSEVEAYMRHHAHQNALMRELIMTPPGKVLVDAQAAAYAEFARSDFYHQWCRPQGFVRAFGTTLVTSTGWRGALMVNISGEPEADQVERFESLLPDLTRALEANKLFGHSLAGARAALNMLEIEGKGGMLFDARGQFIEANASAQDMIESGRLTLRSGRLGCAELQTDRRLAHMVEMCIKAPHAMSSARVRVDSPLGQFWVQCAAYPGGISHMGSRRPAAIAIINDPVQRLRRQVSMLQELFGLTAAEAALALAIVQSGSRKLAAQSRGVSVATARAQLSSIFEKTGARGQTELVRLVMEQG